MEAGLFHHFHLNWIARLCEALNAGGLPPGYYALAEQVAGGPIPDVLTPRQLETVKTAAGGPAGAAILSTPPQARYVVRADIDVYARKANRVAIRHPRGHVVAVVEIVSPGNKSSRNAIRTFVDKLSDLLRQGVHLLVVDLFPPGPRDPLGIHKLIWDEISEEPFALPADKPLIIASYQAGDQKVAYVEPVAVGDVLPDLPLFLEPGAYVLAPLEATYAATWKVFPAALKSELEGPGAT